MGYYGGAGYGGAGYGGLGGYGGGFCCGQQQQVMPVKRTGGYTAFTLVLFILLVIILRVVC